MNNILNKILDMFLLTLGCAFIVFKYGFESGMAVLLLATVFYLKEK